MSTKLEVLLYQLCAEGLTYAAKDVESLVSMYQQENPELNFPTAFMIKRYAFELVMREIKNSKLVKTHENTKS
jgi:hypothetical protein